MSDAESRPKRGKAMVFLVGLGLIVVLAFIPVWKCPPCQGSGKTGLIGLDCSVCKTKGRAAAIPTLAEFYWASIKFRSPVH